MRTVQAKSSIMSLDKIIQRKMRNTVKKKKSEKALQG